MLHLYDNFSPLTFKHSLKATVYFHLKFHFLLNELEINPEEFISCAWLPGYGKQRKQLTDSEQIS